MLSPEGSRRGGGHRPAVLKQHIRRALGKYFFEATSGSRSIVPVIMEV